MKMIPREKRLRPSAAALLFCSLFLVAARPAGALEVEGVITGRTVWEGRVELTGDLLVAGEGHLVIAPGTEVIIHPSKGTRTDPHFFSTGTEIMVRGRLETAGGPEEMVIFRGLPEEGNELWAGIIIDGPSAGADLTGVMVTGAHAGVTAIDTNISLSDSLVTGCRYGLTLLGGAKAEISNTRLVENDYGLADYSGGADLVDSVVSGNREKDSLDGALLEKYSTPRWYRPSFRLYPKGGETEYLGEHSIDGDAAWQGRIIIRGQVVVQPEATLTIEPGTEVAFRRFDTNGDGLGESLLLVLGTIRVLGTPGNGVLFTSAEKVKKPGDWDKVSLIASPSSENLIRHARFEFGYQAFHNHFSSARLEKVIFSDNYRGAQFQESERTVIHGAYFTGNKSAMRFRDSEVALESILVEGNFSGINFLRCRTLIRDTVISGNLYDPLLGRESETRMEGVVVSGNREGPRFKGEGSRLEAADTAVHHNLEDGLSLSGVEAFITGSELSHNGLDGLSVTGGRVRLEESTIRGNGRWAVDNNGEEVIDARSLYWGTTEEEKIEDSLYDRRDDPGIGRVLFRPVKTKPEAPLFPGLDPAVSRMTEAVTVIGDCFLPPGSDLLIDPGTTVRFSHLPAGSPMDLLREHPHFQGSELILAGGSIKAAGSPERPIRFIGLDGTGSSGPSWGAVNVDRADDARFAHSFFQGARTGLHIRESRATVEKSTFTGNHVGLRFHTSPIAVVDNLFLKNATGIRFHFGTPRMEGNLFQENGTAIFISQDPGRIHITGNDFIGNLEYNISLGEMVDGNVEVPGNYWGAVQPVEIEGKFYDFHKDDHLGEVRYRPASGSPTVEKPLPSPDP